MPRANHPFVIVNCAPGAFTGASKTGKSGYFERADKGTIFMDEIGDIPLSIQAKLLQVLQDKEFERVGGTSKQTVDVRIIAATNRDLREAIAHKAFREDLYYRLNVIEFHLPPLRERREDVIPLAEAFIDKYNRLLGSRITGINESAQDVLTGYAWPGNIRELENIMEYLTIFAPEDGVIESASIRNVLGMSANSAQDAPYTTLSEAMGNYEKDILQKTLDSSRTLREAANTLGIDISTVSRKSDAFDARKTAGPIA